MTSSQWIGVGLMLALIGGLLFAFIRHGAKVKREGPHDSGGAADWSDSGHGSGDSGGH